MLIIGITGTLGAGKGTIVEYLVNKKGFKHFSVRGYLSELVKADGNEVNRTTLVDKGNELRKKYGPGFIVDELYKLAKESDLNSIIESIRCPGEVDTLKKHGNLILLSVDADSKLRYERVIKRASETDNISYDEFLNNEKREMTSSDPFKQNLSKCIEMSDIKLYNNSTIADLYDQLEKALKDLQS